VNMEITVPEKYVGDVTGDLNGRRGRINGVDTLTGSMALIRAVAPLAEDPRDAFGRLAEVRASFVAEHPDATWLSAGMSGDFEAAIAAGATHVRVGSAILGARPEIK